MAKQLGEGCSAPTECDSTFCDDGFCCDRACTGGCERCDLSAKEGTCAIVALSDHCDIACVDENNFRLKTCDGVSTECLVGQGDATSCGGGGCLVLASGKGLCAECSTTEPCRDSTDVCRDGKCVDAIAPVPPAVTCQMDADCATAERDRVCAQGACVDRATPSAFASIEPLPFDESCGCRIPGAPSVEVGPLPCAPLTLAAFGTLALVRRRPTFRRSFARVRSWLSPASVRGGLLSLVSGLLFGACSPQEDLPADQACRDTPISLSAVVLACTDDYDKAVRVANAFEGKYRCNATDVNESPRAYRCPAEIRALSCTDVVAANEDHEQYLGRSSACRVLFSHLDGSAVPDLGATGVTGGGDPGGGAGAAGDAQ